MPRIRIQALSESPSPRTFIREFIDFPKRLYRNEPNWIPWFDGDMKKILTKGHPFFEHSPGEFFLASKDGKTVGRICAVANRRYAEEHGKNTGHFFFLDAPDDDEVFQALFGVALEWSKGQGCGYLEGPMLFGGVYGSGMLVEGFESPAPMTMMPYNFPYYPRRAEGFGFAKLFDAVGADIGPDHFSLPERIQSVADKVLARGRFSVLTFTAKAQLKARSEEIARMYNATIGDHLENYPLTDKELEVVKNDLLTIADPRLIKILEYDKKIVGYVFAFRDLNDALRKNRGTISPLAILRLILGMKINRKVYLNGMGILPEYQRLGGNALLYSELTKTVASFAFKEAEIVQINEATELMLKDIEKLGARINKRHRVYTMAINAAR